MTITDYTAHIRETSSVNMVRQVLVTSFEPGDTRQQWKGEAAASFVCAGITSSRALPTSSAGYWYPSVTSLVQILFKILYAFAVSDCLRRRFSLSAHVCAHNLQADFQGGNPLATSGFSVAKMRRCAKVSGRLCGVPGPSATLQCGRNENLALKVAPPAGRSRGAEVVPGVFAMYLKADSLSCDFELVFTVNSEASG